jgi:hypothetical protein
MTANTLAKLLKPFKIKPADIRDGNIVKKGYKRTQFDDAFSRYLSATPIHPLQRYNPYIDSSGLQAFFVSMSAGPEAQLRPYIRPVMRS